MKRESARRAHAWLLLTLGLFLAFHAWEHWPVRAGRDAVLARLERTAWLPLELAFGLLPLVGLLVTAAATWRAPAEGRYPSPAFRRLVRVCGLVGGGFTLLHVATVWAQRLLHGGRPAAAYAAMVDQAGQLPLVAVYVVGSAAVCIYWAQESAAAWLGGFGGQPGPRAVWGVAALFGALLWLILLDELSAYAAGRALL